jgi:chromosome segregation ATPase
MSGYAEASHTLQEMVRDLRDSHRSYRTSHDSWDESIRGVRSLIDDLGAASREIRAGAGQLNAVVQPAASAADSFRVASEQLSAVLPNIQGAADSYTRARGALDQSSETLRQGTQAYARAGADVRALVSGLTEVQAAQGKMMTGWRGELSLVQQTVQDMRAAAESLRASADTAAATASSASGRTESLITAATAAATSAINEAASGAGAVIQPAAQAASSFLAAAERLQQLLPRMEGAAQAYLGSQQALEEVSITVQRSTKGYQDAGEMVGQMLVSLRDSHAEAVRRIRDGVDGALLGSLREAGAQLERFNTQQQSNVTLWDNATGRLLLVLDNLGETAEHFSTIANNVESTSGSSVVASQAFQHAAASLTELMPSLQATTRSHGQIQRSLESASKTFHVGMNGYQAVVDAAAEKLDRGALGYQEAGAALQRMVAALESQHAVVLGAAVQNLEESFNSPLRETGVQLAAISANQASALAAWQRIVVDLQSTMSALQSGTQGATQMADRFKAAADPAASAASSFLEASRRLTGLFPRLAESADGYTRINEALTSAAAELSNSSAQYQVAGEQIGQVTRELQKTLKYQVLGTQKFSESMDRAAGFVRAIGPASERVERAADGLRSASERTAEVVQTIQDSVSTQDEAMTQMRTTAQMVLQAMQHQSSHWGNFLGELDRLQGTLNTSVDTLTTKLPHSIDHTLVHFDAALSEGVSRLGGAIERLREAMDDLQERLEMVMSDSGRRR